MAASISPRVSAAGGGGGSLSSLSNLSSSASKENISGSPSQSRVSIYYLFNKTLLNRGKKPPFCVSLLRKCTLPVYSDSLFVATHNDFSSTRIIFEHVSKCLYTHKYLCIIIGQNPQWREWIHTHAELFSFACTHTNIQVTFFHSKFSADRHIMFFSTIALALTFRAGNSSDAQCRSTACTCWRGRPLCKRGTVLIMEIFSLGFSQTLAWKWHKRTICMRMYMCAHVLVFTLCLCVYVLARTRSLQTWHCSHYGDFLSRI